jgi:hypothetical protein
VQLNLPMNREAIFNQLALVCREVVGDHMNLLAAWLISHEVGEERDEFGQGVVCRGLAKDLTGLGIEAA